LQERKDADLRGPRNTVERQHVGGKDVGEWWEGGADHRGHDGAALPDAQLRTTLDAWSSRAWGVMGDGLERKRKGGKRKRKATHALLDELLAHAQELTLNAYAKNSVKAVKTALRAVKEFEGVYAIERPRMFIAPRYYGDMEASLHNELSICLFAAWLFDHGLAPNTIGTYVSLAKTNLSVGFGWALTVKEMELRLPRMLKGIRRQAKRCRKKRLGWRARYEVMLMEILGPPKGLEGWTQKAVRNVLRQGLLRGADSMPDCANFEVERHSTLGDLEFHSTPSPHASLLVLPAKKSEQQGKTEYVFFPEGDGITDAYTALKRMIACRQRIFGDESSDAPLFCFEDGSFYQVRHVRALFKESGKLIDVDPGELGAQSARAGGATDLMAVNCSPAMLQISGRWVRLGI
jgi:hypothetical protein